MSFRGRLSYSWRRVVVSRKVVVILAERCRILRGELSPDGKLTAVYAENLPPGDNLPLKHRQCSARTTTTLRETTTFRVKGISASTPPGGASRPDRELQDQLKHGRGLDHGGLPGYSGTPLPGCPVGAAGPAAWWLEGTSGLAASRPRSGLPGMPECTGLRVSPGRSWAPAAVPATPGPRPQFRRHRGPQPQLDRRGGRFPVSFLSFSG